MRRVVDLNLSLDDKSRDQRRILGPALALLAIPSVGLTVASSASAAFCQPALIHDYASGLKKLPPVKTLAWPKKDLPFGPAGLRLVKKSEIQKWSPLVVIGDGAVTSRPLGFDLLNESSTRPGTARLNWLVTAQLIRFSGGPHILASKTKRIGDLPRRSRRQFQFAVPLKQGSYLVEIEFRGSSGSRFLGRFGDYLRVVPVKQEIQISLSATTIRPGETLSACLENLGTASIDYGEGFTIQSFNDSTWSKSPISPPGAISLIGLVRGPGEQAALGNFAVPPDAPAGKYRYVWTGNARSGTPLTLAPEFQIQP